MFDQSTITDVRPPVWDGSALQLEWTSTAPEGTVFQVYAGRVLVWHGTSRWVALPMPASRVRIENILEFAKIRGYRDGENPARWRGWVTKRRAANSI